MPAWSRASADGGWFEGANPHVPRSADTWRLRLRTRFGLRRDCVFRRTSGIADRTRDRRCRWAVSSRGPERYPGQRSGHEARAVPGVFFGFTRCPDICPTTLFEISEVIKKLGNDAGRTGAIFITVDPERDTPAALKDYLSNFDPHLRGLTGDPAAVSAALKAYRVYAQKIPLKDGDYTMDHTAAVYLMDKNGHFVALFNLKQTPEAAADQLRGYL